MSQPLPTPTTTPSVAAASAPATDGVHDPYVLRPWLNSYPANAPHEPNLPAMVVPTFLRQAAQRWPDRIAYAYYGREMTFSEVDRLSSRFANQLLKHGLKRGEPVLVILPNVPAFPVVYNGIMKAGGVVAALSPLLVEREITQLAADSGARIIITLDRVWDRVEPIVKRGEVDIVIVTGPQDDLPFIKRVLYPIKFRKEMVKVAHNPKAGVWHYRKFLSGSDTDPQIALAPDDVAAFQYTGGTTGLPKAAVLTHRNMTANTQQLLQWVQGIRDGEEVMMAILPFFHSYGVTLCLNTASMIGATTVLVPRFEISDVMDQIAKYQPTLLPGIPTLYNAINGAAGKNPERQATLTSIRLCISGGAPMPIEVQRRFEELTGGRLVEGFGLSEASPVTHANPLDGRARNGTIGMPLPGTEARLVDLTTREPVPVGERGELLVRGPQVMQGYWKRPEDTAAVLSADGWLATGDIAVMDADGYFTIVDRQKDVVISGGENIYPREVEEVLYLHPQVLEAAVIGVPHPAAGQIVKAFVVLKPGETLERTALAAFCAERLSKPKVPRQIEYRDALPKSAAGKILRRALQEEEAAKASRPRGRSRAAAEAEVEVEVAVATQAEAVATEHAEATDARPE